MRFKRRITNWGLLGSLVVSLGGAHSASRLAAQEVLYPTPAADRIEVRTEQIEGSDVVVDLYQPPDLPTGPRPAVVFALGYPDDALSVGPLKDWAPYRTWARLVASEGMVGILYSTAEPVADLETLMHFIGTQGERLGLDATRVALWSTSANGAVALKYARSSGPVSPAAVVAYTAILPTPGNIASAALDSIQAELGFALPEYEDEEAYPTDLPMYLVRAGLERFPQVRRSMDEFVQYAFDNNLKVIVRNYPEGHHSFDITDDTTETREIIRQTLDFLKHHLRATP